MCRHEHDRATRTASIAIIADPASAVSAGGASRRARSGSSGCRAHEQRLQADLKNVQDLIGSLAAPSAPASEV